MQTYKAPIKNRKIRFALVGCGRIAQNHFMAIEHHSDFVELIAVCDVDSVSLEKAASRTMAKPYTNLSSMLAKCDLDAVIITTPSGLHSAQTVEIARSGRHVVTEKPMATRWYDGLKMIKECDEANVRLFVVKQNRRNTTLQLVKNAIDQGRFGRIYMVNINVFWSRLQDYYDSANWRGTWEFDGGAFMNQASHYIDLLDWLIGPIESLQAYTATLARNIEVEDTGVVSLRWRSGALGSMNVTMLTYLKNFEGSITILGEKGTVRIGGVAVNEIQKWEFSEPRNDDEAVAGASYQTNSVYGFGHTAYYENIINVLRGRASPDTDGREGLKSLEIIIATYLSARDGRRVSLPLDY
jgi:UDP-N-acetyl-2-amino-2-deoxyglucuronate dehydrogenase